MPDNKIDLSEISILSKILSDTTSNTLLTAATQLTPEDFMDSRNRLLFQTFLEMDKKQMVIDIPNTLNELTNLKLLDAIGGMPYLNTIVEKGIGIAPVENYIDTIKDKSLLSKFLGTLTNITKNANEKPITDISDFIGEAEANILKVTQQRRVADVANMSTISDDIITNLVKQTDEFKSKGKRPDGITGQETGYAELDRLTRGWQKGAMIVVGARPSVGKTAFALNLIYQVAKKGVPAILFTLEMSTREVAMRLLTLVSNLTSDEINSLSYLHGSTKEAILVDPQTDQDTAIAQKLQNGLIELSQLPIFIDDNPGAKILDIMAKCKKLKNLIPNVGLIAIDYLGLISGSGRNDNRQSEVSEISRQIKLMAKSLEIPIVALTQLNRDTEKRDNHRPQISDIRDSGSIEQDADIIMMLYRPDYYSAGNKKGDDILAEQPDNSSPISEVDVSIVKNRNGRLGDLKYIFDKAHCSFNIVEEDHDF